MVPTPSGRSLRLRLAWPIVIHYSYGRIVHSGRACPQGFGDFHPYLERSEFPAWRWYWGGLLGKLDLAMHRQATLKALWCPRICDKLVGDRGPYKATRRFTAPVSWANYPFPVSEADRRRAVRVAAQRRSLDEGVWADRLTSAKSS